MTLLGIHLTLLIGATVPTPAPVLLTEALQQVRVTHSDESGSGFQMTFAIGRGGSQPLLDYPLLSSPLLAPFNRVILLVTTGAIPQLLMDGLITHHQLTPGATPGASTLTVTGKDVSVVMGREEKSVEHPAQNEAIIVAQLLMGYARYGLIPEIIPPPVLTIPLPTEMIPVQTGSDLAYIKELAAHYGFLFYVVPGPLPGSNTAYWGPPRRLGVPQKALTVNMGPATNVSSIQFARDEQEPTTYSGTIQDKTTDKQTPVRTSLSERPPLAAQSSILKNSAHMRSTQFRQGGLTTQQAWARAQAQTDKSTDNVVTATGELNALRYGDLLQPRGIVGLRGAGYSYDGLYYVKEVTHTIARGSYTQGFQLAREGVGAISPLVRP